jgi:hypothetical protein
MGQGAVAGAEFKDWAGATGRKTGEVVDGRPMVQEVLAEFVSAAQRMNETWARSVTGMGSASKAERANLHRP